MLSPTSMSAMSIETISKAVCESSRRASTALEMRSGFSSTCVCESDEPMALTMPSPTRAMIVSSVAPPINWLQVRADGDAGLDLQLDAVLGHGVERFAAAAAGRAVDHLGIDARLHGFQHVAAGQVDGRGQLEVEIDRLGLLGGDDRANHQRHVAAGQVMGLERLARDARLVGQAGLHGHDLAADDHRGIDLAKRHAQQVEDADSRARS